MMNAIVPNSAKSFNFQQEFKLTDEETLDISDHYPVEVELKTKDASGEGQSKKKGQQEQKRKQGQASNVPTKRGRRAV
ncbi:deoxyribonuclease gamma-like [Neolamprologus brichardi]|uniref:deoxyribonuclease gamma-like n=1 Tax=Neolamprologus brichardi TaxID=32507 RepID=UPI001643AB3E|nr:deoxyribonuclease gamma-like [Neolamprologus brichardi]